MLIVLMEEYIYGLSSMGLQPRGREKNTVISTVVPYYN
jgi:hypothetical protein